MNAWMKEIERLDRQSISLKVYSIERDGDINSDAEESSPSYLYSKTTEEVDGVFESEVDYGYLISGNEVIYQTYYLR